MKPSDRVIRVQFEHPKEATILEIISDTARISYDEGGEGWWPLSALELIEVASNEDWGKFKSEIFNDPRVNSVIANAIPLVPIAALALPSTLMKAEAGDAGEFTTCWKAVATAAQISPELVQELVELAQECNLPEPMVAALQTSN